MEYIGDWMLHDMAETGSTNDEVKKLSANIRGQKVVISARSQTNGRGRRGRGWVSLDGNLFFSLGVENELKNLGALVFIASLSLWQTVRNLDPLLNVKLKWPNDVLVNDKKISGMLLEKGAGGYWVIGIGVNLKVAPLLVNTLYPAVSLAEAGINVERLDFLRSFIAEFDNYFNLWKTEGFEPIRREWLAHVKSLDEEILVRLEDEELEGIFRGVDEHGSLLLETSGRIRRIYAGDVFYPQRKQIVNE